MTAALDDAYARCEALVRQADRDRWLAALFVPSEARRHVLALNAFSLEAARVREQVRDPLPGEVRLQWWIDAIEGHGHGDVSSHPVAAALLDSVARFKLSRPGLAALVEARRFDLYDDPMPSLNDLEGYLGETVSTLLQQAAIVLAGGGDPQSADVAGHAGVAYGLTGLMRALPVHARRGQVYLPADVLARHGADAAMVRGAETTPAIAAALAELREHARHHLQRAMAAMPSIDPRARPAFVGLGLVEPYLSALERQRDPFAAVADLAGWRKPLALWRFARRLR
ncbi:MAG TPA: phytoene/squalene synthase family protein [Methylomirabilota bacterium]|nr:phytoene/squalene synthase family protein [Methylomirabilota bacterium]